MNSLINIILLPLLISCATTKNVKDSKDLLFSSVTINQQDLISAIEQFSAVQTYQPNKAAIKVALNYVKETNYNKMFIDYAESLEDFSLYKLNQTKISNAPISRKVEFLKLKKATTASFDQYFSNLNEVPDISERIDLFEKLIKSTFPSAIHTHFFAHLGRMLSYASSKTDVETLLRNIRKENHLFSLKLNLYFFQKVSNKDIKELLILHKSPEFKQTRKFIEKIQLHVNKLYLQKLQRKLDKSFANRRNISLN